MNTKEKSTGKNSMGKNSTGKNSTGKSRQQNLELLRVLSMLMIVTMHLLNHGGVLEHVEQGSISYYLVWTMFGVSFVAINCYVLISGYFLNGAQFSFRRILKLEGQVWFYSIALYLVSLLVFRRPVDVSELVSAVFPVLSCEYWFVTMYVGMLLLSPFLNRMILGMGRRQFQVLLGLCFVLFSLWPTVFFFSPGLNFGGGSGVVWFSVLYLTGAYLKRFPRRERKPGKAGLAVAAAAALLLIPASRFVIEGILKTPLGGIGFLQDLMWGYSLFYQYHSVLVLAASLLLFVFFLQVEVKSSLLSGLVKAAAPLCFGVYLIHDNPNIRQTLWGTLNPAGLCGKWYLVPCILGMICLVFVCCAVLEWVRRLAAKWAGGLWKRLAGSTGRETGGAARLCDSLDRKLFWENELGMPQKETDSPQGEPETGKQKECAAGSAEMG